MPTHRFRGAVPDINKFTPMHQFLGLAIRGKPDASRTRQKPYSTSCFTDLGTLGAISISPSQPIDHMLAELNRRSASAITRPSVKKHTTRRFIHYCFKRIHSLCGRKGNRFNRAAKRRQAMHACLQQKAHNQSRALRAEAFTVVESRDGSGEHSTQF